MKLLNLDGNAFTGAFVAQNLPPNLSFVDASGNNFSGIAVVESKTRTRFSFRVSGISSAADENGNKRTHGVYF